MGFTLILGGARSGKSDRALRMAVESGLPVTFIATASAGDSEMDERIRRHRASRPLDWTTVEEPIDIVSAAGGAPAADFVIVDCLTLWVSNLLGAGWTAEQVQTAARQAADALASRRGAVVTNEVGLGIVPANELARRFRDVLGDVNTAFARCADRSVLMVAGRALELT
jgi:adenosyl cobinamide kinase/adenosyl cobinamide phosphate guanylyltransferase